MVLDSGESGETEKARENYKRFYDFWKDGDFDRERVEEARTKLEMDSQ